MKKFPLSVLKFGGLMSLLLTSLSANAALTHRYSFNDSVSSTNAVDSVGGATGNLYPGASYPGDGTVQLDGNSGYVYLPNDIISNYTSFAFEVWTTPAANATWARLFDFGINQGGPGTGGAGGTGGNGVSWTYVCFADGAGLYHGDLNSATGESIILGPSPAVGVLHHIVFTEDAAAHTAALFDNGVQVSFEANFTITPQAVGHTFNDYIGRSQWPDPYYNGSIDEFRIYNNAQTPVQVEADYESGSSITNASPGSLAGIQFGSSGNTLLGAIISPSVVATYSGLTNKVNITTIPGITYSSDNTNIISFGADGNFHATALGAATLHATYQSQSAALTVTVNPQPLVLQHRYSFDGQPGDTDIPDSVGGLDGTLVNGSSTSTLTGTGQLTLDGNASSAYVSLPSGILPTLTNATFEVWVNFSGGPVWQELYSFGTNNGSAGIDYTALIPHNGANGKLRWGINEGGEVDIDGPSELATNTEVCVTVSYNFAGQTASIYVNGRKVGSGAESKALYTIPDVDNYFGRSQFSSDPYFQGSIDEIRIYSGAASDLQVAVDSAAGPSNIVASPGALGSVTVSGPSSVDAHGLGSSVFVTANFANVSNVDVTTQATITCSDSSVATIVNGNVVPQNAGAATITASYGGVTGVLPVTVVDANSWPSLLHHYAFHDPAGSSTIADSVGNINGTLEGQASLNGTQLVMPTPNPVSAPNGMPTANSGWVMFPSNEGLVTTLPNEASFEIWVIWSGGPVWQEMFDFGQGGTPGFSLGGGQYIMICPYDGANGLLRAEWDQNPAYDVTLQGPALQAGVLSQVIYTHDQDRQLDKLYRNGVLVASAPNTALWSAFPDTDNWMARDEWQDPMFQGAYSDFRIWNGALTSGQVANLYTSGPGTVAGPSLQISPSGSHITLTWPANASGFTLQSSASLSSPNWTAVGGTPTVVNGLNVLTVPLSPIDTFYRLKD
ncbi:MAG TPA: LamG domain-containing protein [Verrucomicrobiae bacterium]